MASIFSRIIAGELPARFVWKDDSCVAFLSIHPLRPGHTLVVPREEIDHWLDLDGRLLAHVAETAQAVGKAQMVHNNATPHVEVDPETYEVRADGVHLTCEPATVLPLAQRYFLY